MNRSYKCAVALLFFLFTWAVSAQQIRTWMCPASSARSFTNNIAAGQVMEVLSGSFEPDSQIEVNMGTDRLIMGNGGANLNVPFVLAGPATVIFKKTATGGQGTIISYRIVPQQR